MTSKQKSRDSEGRAVNDKGIAFTDVLAAARRGEELDSIDVLEAQSWRIDNQKREIASLRKELLAARASRDETQPVASNQRGVYRKYNVTRADGESATGRKHADCAYFVLDLDHDPHARVALKAYADSCRADYPNLAADLDSNVKWCAFGGDPLGELLPVETSDRPPMRTGLELIRDGQIPQGMSPALFADRVLRVAAQLTGDPYKAVCQGGSGGKCTDPDCEKCWPEEPACDHVWIGGESGERVRCRKCDAVKAVEQLYRLRQLCICDNALTNQNPACPIHGSSENGTRDV